MAYPTYFSDMPRGKEAPRMGVRILSKTVWQDVIQRQWEDSKNKSVPAPTLAPPSAGRVYFTDAESIQVCSEATDFGLRLSLWRPDLFQIQVGGCAVVYFDTTNVPVDPEAPEQNRGGTAPPNIPLPPRGLTTGGAREWMTSANVKLTKDMEVFVVEGSGSRWGPLGL